MRVIRLDKVPEHFVFLLAPSQAPDFVIAEKLGSTCLTVKWNRLPQEHFQGQPIGYSIKYYPNNLRGAINYVSVNFASNTTTLTNLTVYTVYVINVSAVSLGGIGPASTATAQTGAEGII